MAERHRMDDEEIGSIVAGMISAAEQARQVEDADGKLQATTKNANDYYRGVMTDLPAETGRSSVVDHTVQDVIGWLLPGLMRVFFSVDQVVIYEPKTPEDEEGAEQATDYVNHIVLNESNAYQVFWDAFHDALLHRNGVVKHFWDDTPLTVTEKQSGLTDDQFVALTAADDVEVIEHTERSVEDITLDPFGAPIVSVAVIHDVKIKRTIASGSLRLEAVAPDYFLIDEEAKELDEKTRFVGERFIKTRSELIEMGFPRDKVEDLPAGTNKVEDDGTGRGRSWITGGRLGTDKATDEIELYETYPLIDWDGDGIAERLKVISAGPSTADVLDWEEWEDDLPYSDLTPERVPHRWEGRSVFDDTQDIQRVKTFLMRQMLDSVYQANVPDKVIDINRIKSPDAIYDRQIGNVILAEGDTSTAVYNAIVPFVGQHSFAVLEYMDQVIERRTGVSRSAMGLDPETLQNQSATAANIQQSAQYSKIELIARNFAELGMKRVFKCLLKLIVKHQDKARTVRLRNEWVDMDPSVWNAEMDATINVGLGSGSRDRDLTFLQLIEQSQMAAYQLAGGMGTPYGQKMAKALLHTAQKKIEATGLKSPDMFFPEATDEDMQAIAQAQGQNPEAMKAQAEMAMKQQEAQFKAQLEQVAMQKEAALEEAQAQADLKVEQAETSGKLTLEQMKFEFQRQMEMLRFWMDMQRENARMAGQQQGDGKAPSVPLDQVRDIIKRSGVEIPAELEAMKPPPTPVENLSEQMMKLQQENRELFGQLASYIAAPVKVIRDPETGKVTGGQKILN